MIDKEVVHTKQWGQEGSEGGGGGGVRGVFINMSHHACQIMTDT